MLIERLPEVFKGTLAEDLTEEILYTLQNSRSCSKQSHYYRNVNHVKHPK